MISKWVYKFAAPIDADDLDDVDDEGFVEDESGEVFWGSRGSGILFVRSHPRFGSQLLLVLRSPHVEQPNTWGVSGGAVPRGEDNLFNSALRETLEELGSLPRKYKQIGQYTWQQPGGSFTYVTFIVLVLDEWTPRNFNWEVNDARWVSLDDAVGFDLHFGLSDLIENLGPSIYKGAAKKLAQRTRDEILDEYRQVYNAAYRKAQELQDAVLRQAKTYYESILEDHTRREQSKVAWQPMLTWMQTVLSEVQATGDAQFIQTFQEELERIQTKVLGSEPKPDPAEYENYYDEEVLEWYLDGDSDVNEHIVPLLDANKIPWDVYTFPTGKKVMTIQTNDGFWVIEQDKDGIRYWQEPEDWISDAFDHIENYYPETDFSSEFWDGVGRGSVLYHATPDENVESILTSGLEAREETRGLSNRNMGPAVFTISGENTDDIAAALESYGTSIIAIDVGAMKADGYMPTVDQETPVAEGEMKRALAAAIGWDDYSPDEESDYMPDTIAIYGDIPPKYLSLSE